MCFFSFKTNVWVFYMNIPTKKMSLFFDFWPFQQKETCKVFFLNVGFPHEVEVLAKYAMQVMHIAALAPVILNTK